MTWIDDTLNQTASSSIILNDSKTPSGRSHVGALRGVLIHDALRREATHRGKDAKFLFGCDDMDALDEIPFGKEEEFRQYLGQPLHAVPPPERLEGKNMAEAYFGELVANFAPLGVEAHTYNVRDLYVSGQMDESIHLFLSNPDAVARIYADVSGSQRMTNLLPFQPVCEQCGRLGTTQATDYDGETIAYYCSATHVKWAQGCGYTGRQSPFGGLGKLTWKAEWAAKWKILGVTIEGAGKDHMTATGSHAVSSALSREVLSTEVPVSLLYEFFLLGGAKMSSSKGLGVAATDMVELMPADVLRHLILRVPARQAVEFTPDLQTIGRSFLDYEKLRERVVKREGDEEDEQLYRIACAQHVDDGDPVDFSPPFDTVASLLQLPHVKITDHAAEVKGSALTDMEAQWLQVKAATADFWLSRYSEGVDRIRLRDEPPASLDSLTPRQVAFLVGFRHELRTCEWTPAVIQALVFDVARMAGLAQRDAFKAFYSAFFDTAKGPRAGSFLSFLGRDRAVEHLSLLQASYKDLLDAQTFPKSDVDVWGKVDELGDRVHYWLLNVDGYSAVECTWVENDKRHAVRARMPEDKELLQRAVRVTDKFTFQELTGVEVVR